MAYWTLSIVCLQERFEIFHEWIELIHISENNQILSFNNITFFKNMLYSIREGVERVGNYL